MFIKQFKQEMGTILRFVRNQR